MDLILVNSGLSKRKKEAELQWKNLKTSNSSKLFFDDNKCFQVNAINSYYSNLFLRGISKETLAQLAEKFISSTSLVSCHQSQITNDLELYPIFNYDLNIINETLWDNKGFDFWASYKIYLSWAWRNSQIPEIINHPMNRMTLITPLEENILLLSNGCKSIENPVCNSDFLSASELRSLFTTDRSKLELTGSSLEMKDLIMDNNDNTDLSAKSTLARKSADNAWIKDFQKSYLGFSTKLIDNLYASNKLFSSAFTQKSSSQLSSDLINEMQKDENVEEAYYLCTEHRILMQEQPFNIFKVDIDNLKANGVRLNQILKYGMTVSEMLTAYEKLSTSINSACNQLDSKLKNESESKWNNYRPWFKNFLSRYQIIKVAMDLEKQENQSDSFIDTRPKSYLKNLCVNAIDCHRNFTESMVMINKLMLHSRTFLRTEIQSAPIFTERSEKIACGLYDPFESARLNKKKLLADLTTSVLFGWTSLPIYLDFNFKPSKQTSFNKLVDDGHIKFDSEFDKDQVSKTLALSLGSFVNVPCSINLSESGDNVSNADGNYIFKGLSFNACKGKKNESITSPTGSIDVFKKSPDSDFQFCGQCALNFEKISTLAVLNTFAPLRFILRLTQSLMRYHSVKNDDSINPREFNISIKELIKTYKNNNNTIPEKCVALLARGLSCQKNVCEALAVKEFELKTGLEVESIKLSRNPRSNFKANSIARIKTKNCKNDAQIELRCRGNGSNFLMNIKENQYKKCLE